MPFAPSDPGFVADPYPVYRELRRDAPVRFDEPTDHWLVSRYGDVNALLRDRRLGRTYLHTATHEEMGYPPDPAWHAPFWRLIRSGILDMEPPDHTRVRRLVAKAFTPKYVESLRPGVQRILDRLVDPLAEGGEFDLLPAVAEPLPVAVIAEMLGVPEGDRSHLRPWSADICKMYELKPDGRVAARCRSGLCRVLRVSSAAGASTPAPAG
jgi:cytochrome P450